MNRQHQQQQVRQQQHDKLYSGWNRQLTSVGVQLHQKQDMGLFTLYRGSLRDFKFGSESYLPIKAPITNGVAAIRESQKKEKKQQVRNERDKTLTPTRLSLDPGQIFTARYAANKGSHKTPVALKKAPQKGTYNPSSNKYSTKPKTRVKSKDVLVIKNYSFGQQQLQCQKRQNDPNNNFIDQTFSQTTLQTQPKKYERNSRGVGGYFKQGHASLQGGMIKKQRVEYHQELQKNMDNQISQLSQSNSHQTLEIDRQKTSGNKVIRLVPGPVRRYLTLESQELKAKIKRNYTYRFRQPISVLQRSRTDANDRQAREESQEKGDWLMEEINVNENKSRYRSGKNIELKRFTQADQKYLNAAIRDLTRKIQNKSQQEHQSVPVIHHSPQSHHSARYRYPNSPHSPHHNHMKPKPPPISQLLAKTRQNKGHTQKKERYRSNLLLEYQKIEDNMREIGKGQLGGYNDLGKLYVGDKVDSLKRIITQYVEKGFRGRSREDNRLQPPSKRRQQQLKQQQATHNMLKIQQDHHN